jgi:hypothetical protein
MIAAMDANSAASPAEAFAREGRTGNVNDVRVPSIGEPSAVPETSSSARPNAAANVPPPDGVLVKALEALEFAVALADCT